MKSLICATCYHWAIFMHLPLSRPVSLIKQINRLSAFYRWGQRGPEGWDSWSQVLQLVNVLHRWCVALGTAQHFVRCQSCYSCIYFIHILGKSLCQTLMLRPHLPQALSGSFCFQDERSLSHLCCRAGKNALSWASKWMSLSYRAQLSFPAMSQSEFMQFPPISLVELQL